MGIEHNNEGSGSVQFGRCDSSVRFGFGCQTLWVRSVRFRMALEWGSSSVCSVRFPSLNSTLSSCITSTLHVIQWRLTQAFVAAVSAGWQTDRQTERERERERQRELVLLPENTQTDWECAQQQLARADTDTHTQTHTHWHVTLSAPHNCNKTTIKEFYKTCRTLAAYLALLDIMQIVFPCSQWKHRVAARARPAIVTSLFSEQKDTAQQCLMLC